jgi:predicted RNA binding protein YcfA (HicA-like mRNA interferase family)
MPSSREILRALRRIGYAVRTGRGKGSHAFVYFEHQGKQACVTTIQKARDIPSGTLALIRRAIGLTDREGFEKFMRGELTREEYVGMLLGQGIIKLDDQST